MNKIFWPMPDAYGETDDDIIDWLHDNIGNRASGWDLSVDDMCLVFEREEDAIMFRLTFNL
jgi:hypothetical protein